MKAAGGGVGGKTEEEIRAAVHRYSVRPKSLKSYMSELRRLRKWHRLMLQTSGSGRIVLPDRWIEPDNTDAACVEDDFVQLGLSFTKFDYYTFLYGHIKVLNIQYRKARSALKMAQTMAGVPTWAGDPECIQAEKAAFHARQIFQPDTRLRGTMTALMVDEFTDWVMEKSQTIATAMCIQMGGALRISELLSLTKGRVTREGIMLKNTKRSSVKKMTSSKDTLELKKLNRWGEGMAALERLWTLKDATPGDDATPLFPRSAFTIKEYNDLLKEAATALEFPDGLKYDGSHILRHAGIGLAVATMVKRKFSMTQMAACLLMSDQMICHYALTNSERIAKKTVPAALADCVRASKKSVRRCLDSENEDSEIEEEEVEMELTQVTLSGNTGATEEVQRIPPATQTVLTTPRAPSRRASARARSASPYAVNPRPARRGAIGRRLAQDPGMDVDAYLGLRLA